MNALGLTGAGETLGIVEQQTPPMEFGEMVHQTHEMSQGSAFGGH